MFNESNPSFRLNYFIICVLLNFSIISFSIFIVLFNTTVLQSLKKNNNPLLENIYIILYIERISVQIIYLIYFVIGEFSVLIQSKKTDISFELTITHPVPF